MSSRKTSPKQNSRRAFDSRAFPISSGTLLEPKNSKSSLRIHPTKKQNRAERFTEKLLTNKKLSELLAPGGVFVLEKRPGEALPETKLWHVVRQKKYGATEVLFLSAATASPARTNPQGVHPPRPASE